MSPIINKFDLQHAIDKVKRVRAQKKDQEIWKEFCSKQFYTSSISSDEEKICNSKVQPNVEEEDNDDWLYLPLLANKKNNLVETVIRDSNDDVPAHTELLEVKKTVENETAVSSATRSSKDISSERAINEAQKLSYICTKITQIVTSMKSQLMNFQIPDEPPEMIRFQKKSNEFCARFSRNHLYHFELQVKEIKALHLHEPFVEWEEYSHCIHKIINVYQTLLQAFTMFQRNMWLTWGLGDTVTKLYTMVKRTLELIKFSTPYQDKADISVSLQELNQSCLEMKESLSEILTKCNNVKDFAHLKSQNSLTNCIVPELKLADKMKNNTLKCDCHHIANRGEVKKNSVSGDRYSMYRSRLPSKSSKQTKCLHLKGQPSLNAPKLAKQKPVIKNPKISTLTSNKCPQVTNKTGNNFRRFHTNNKNIVTSAYTGVKSSILQNNKKLPSSTASTKVNECRNRKSCYSRPKYRWADVENPDTLVTHHAAPSVNSSSSKEGDVLTSAGDAGPNYSAEAGGAGVGRGAPSTTPRPSGPSGEGGARRINCESQSKNKSGNVLLLLCSHNESLPPQSFEEPNTNNGTTPKKKVNDNINISNVDDDTKLSDGTAGKQVLKCDNAKKMKIPQATRDAFIDYRLQFVKHMVKSPMYTPGDIQSKPWEAVTRISENLISEMLNNITQEMEMEDLLQHLVRLELDLCL